MTLSRISMAGFIAAAVASGVGTCAVARAQQANMTLRSTGGAGLFCCFVAN